METRQYLDLAGQAANEGAHVAVAMYYMSAMDSAASTEEAASVIELAMEYAGNLKKRADRRAMYEWGAQVSGEKGLHGLEAMAQQSLENLEVVKDGSA